MDKLKEKKKKRFGRVKKALLALFLLITVPIVILGIWNWRNFSGSAQELFGSNNIFDMMVPSPLDNTSGRVNILVAGYGMDEPDHGGSDLTDSIMVLSLDQVTNTGFILSVPRDFYVDIPGRGQAKINEAFQVGEAQEFSEPGYADGGMGLLSKVINDTYGVDIHYHALVDFSTVSDVVDAIGGIDVSIDSSDERGLYDPIFGPRHEGPLRLSNGPHHLDGLDALKLTRARGSGFGAYGFPRSDFTRTQHQHLVLSAIKDKLAWQTMIDPRKNGPILDTIAEHVQTDVELREALPLYRLMSSIPNEALKSVGLHDIDDVNYYSGYTTPIGLSAIIPAAGINQYTDIQDAVRQLLQ